MEKTPALIPQPRKRGVRWQFYLAGLLALAFLIYLFQPGVFTWWLRRHLISRAAESDTSVNFSKVEADFFTGHAVLSGMELRSLSQSANHVSTAEIQVEFSPWRYFFHKEKSPIQKITVGKTQVDWKWASGTATKSERSSKRISTHFQNRFPDAFVGNGISAHLECGHARIDVANADFNFQPNVAGDIDIPHMEAALFQWKRTFNNLEGTTAIKDRALYVGGIKFTPDLVLERGALDFTRPDRQKITSDLLFSAFGGQWRTDVDLDRRKSPIDIDTASSFWNLSVRQLGEFLGNDTFADGIIHEGRLTFHGSPNELAKSTTTLRLNATDFRWHERRWNSLIASGLLINRHIDIPQFDLVQDKNQIQLKGTADLPVKWTQLPSEFQFQVLAQIDDLHSAALLVLPGQKSFAGEAFFAGEVRNLNGQFSGNLKMRGGPLEISGVKVDRARGDLELQGSEVSAKSLELARRDDVATGWATLDLAEPRRYSGEFQVTARDIADYAAILPKAVADHAAAGGVKLWWSGDGTSHAHSGAFKVNLSDFLVSHEANAVPLDVESHGSYSPAGITLNHITLHRPTVKLDAAIIVRPESMELRDLHVVGSGASSVEGNITLPINLLSALETPTLASLLDSKASATGKIIGNRIRLDELSELAGGHQSVRGRITFSLNAEGPLDSVQAELDLKVNDFFISENLAPFSDFQVTASVAQNQLKLESKINSGEPRDSITLDVTAQTALSQANLIQGRWLDETAPVSGTITATRVAWPALHPWWIPAREFKGDSSANLTLSGTPQTPQLDGQIILQNTEWQPAWLSYPLQKLNGIVTLAKDRLTSVNKITGNYRGGTFNVGGSAGLNPNAPVDLAIEGKNLTLSAQNDPSEAVVNGSVHLQDSDGTRLISGAVQLQNAVLHRELHIVQPEVALPAVNRFALPWVSPDWKLDLQITAAQPIEIRGQNSTWQAEPELIAREFARTPLFLGKLHLRPLSLTQIATSENAETLIYFTETTLENGVVEDAQPPPLAEPNSTPTLEKIPRRLEILPVAPTEAHPS